MLRQHIGQDEKVGEYIMKEPILEKSWEQISSLIVTLNPEYKKKENHTLQLLLDERTESIVRFL